MYRIKTLRFGVQNCVGSCTTSIQEKGHPNAHPFSGTLLILDQASDKPPHGAEGHRIYVPKATAKRRLGTLIGMALNYAGDLQGHSPGRKVGVITGAWIEGEKVKVKGIIWKKDFSGAVEDLSAGKIGMSMELADVYVRNRNEDVWHLEDFHFSGATALYKSAAAYYQTALAAAEQALGVQGGGHMAKVNGKEKGATGGNQGELLAAAIAKAVGPAVAAAMKEAVAPVVDAIEAQAEELSKVLGSIEELKTVSIEAARDSEDEEENEEEIDIEAAGKHKKDEGDGEGDGDGDGQDNEDEEDGVEAEAADTSGLEDLEEGEPDDEDEPGEINKEAKNEGSKTSLTKNTIKHKKMAIKAAANSPIIRELYASNRELVRTVRAQKEKFHQRMGAMRNKLDALEAQVEQYAERTDRRTLSPEVLNILAKSNVDHRELQANGQKLSVAQVDQIFASSGIQLDVTTRMWLKNQLLQADLMEQGEVRRNG